MFTRLRYALFGLVALLAITSPLQATSPEMSGDAPPASSGVWYEIFVRSWVDTNGDGIGDLNGVTAKLDYLQSLGVSGIWLMPINPSPSYHGYDVTDYRGINPEYGTLADFDHLLAEAHKRGIRIIMDLVINHSSNEHPWFKAARDPASPYHDWYQWSNQHTDLDATSATGSPAWHALVSKDLPFSLPAVHLDMLWHERDARSPAHKWLRQHLEGMNTVAQRQVAGISPKNDTY
jgi:glycosidase